MRNQNTLKRVKDIFISYANWKIIMLFRNEAAV